MYELTVSTHSNSEAFDVVIIDEELAIQYFNTAIKAIDASEVCLIDATTGEVIHLWVNGKFTVLGKTIIH